MATRFNVTKEEMKELLEAEKDRRGMVDPVPDMAEAIRKHRAGPTEAERQRRISEFLTGDPDKFIYEEE